VWRRQWGDFAVEPRRLHRLAEVVMEVAEEAAERGREDQRAGAGRLHRAQALDQRVGHRDPELAVVLGVLGAQAPAPPLTISQRAGGAGAA